MHGSHAKVVMSVAERDDARIEARTTLRGSELNHVDLRSSIRQDHRLSLSNWRHFLVTWLDIHAVQTSRRHTKLLRGNTGPNHAQERFKEDITSGQLQ